MSLFPISESRWKDKQKILEILDVNARLETIYEMMLGEIEILQVEKRSSGASKSRWKRPRKIITINEARIAGNPRRSMGEKG